MWKLQIGGVSVTWKQFQFSLRYSRFLMWFWWIKDDLKKIIFSCFLFKENKLIVAFLSTFPVSISCSRRQRDSTWNINILPTLNIQSACQDRKTFSQHSLIYFSRKMYDNSSELAPSKDLIFHSIKILCINNRIFQQVFSGWLNLGKTSNLLDCLSSYRMYYSTNR